MRYVGVSPQDLAKGWLLTLLTMSAPPFPVVNAKPTGFSVLGNFKLGDWFRLVAGTAAGGAWGFLVGARPCSHRAPVSALGARCLRGRCARAPHPRPSALTAGGRACRHTAGKPIRRQGSIYMAALGGFLCFTASFQSSYHRLTGQRPNPGECARYGVTE